MFLFMWYLHFDVFHAYSVNYIILSCFSSSLVENVGDRKIGVVDNRL